MARKFLTPIKLTNLTSDPGSGSEGELYFNSTDKDIKFYSDSQWSSLTSSIVGFGLSYPNSPSNGQLFYNITTGRLSIYYDSVWREMAFYDEVAQIDGGDASIASFDGGINGGGAGTTEFINLYDGGTLRGFTPEENPTGGNAATTNFTPQYDGGDASTTTFSLTVDAGSA